MSETILERLKKPGVLVADGSTGVMLQSMGLENGMAPEVWVLERPEAIRELHRAYVNAGSDLILTCTFGGTRLRLVDSELGDRVVEVNRRAAELARAEASGNVFVAGDIGPTGTLLDPLGDLTYEEAVEVFAEQATGLTEGGVDLFWVETMSDLREAQAAIEGVHRVSNLPITACMSFDMNGYTMMGTTPKEAIESLLGCGASVVGGNCGRALEEMEGVVSAMHTAFPEVPLIAKPNAGLPRLVGDDVVYDIEPEAMAQFVMQYVESGAKIVGGCCGSTPAHIAAIAQAVKG